jgi:hypothetical protein
LIGLEAANFRQRRTIYHAFSLRVKKIRQPFLFFPSLGGRWNLLLINGFWILSNAICLYTHLSASRMLL